VASENFKNYEFKLGKLGLILFITGMSTLLFAVFALGVFIGKDLDTRPGKIVSDIPGAIKEKIGLTPAKSENPAAAKPENQEEAKSAAVDRQPAFNWTFYDTLGRKKGEERGIIPDKEGKVLSREASGPAIAAAVPSAAEQRPVPAGTNASADGKAEKAPATDKKDKRSLPPVSKQPIGKNVANEAKKEPPKATSPTAKALQEKGLVVADVGGRTDKKVSATKAVPAQNADKQEKKVDAAGTFLVQVVSYKEKGKSELVAKKVRILGFKAKIVPVDLAAKGKWYRVVVDGFETKEKAQKAAQKIRGHITGAQCIVRANGPTQKASR